MFNEISYAKQDNTICLWVARQGLQASNWESGLDFKTFRHTFHNNISVGIPSELSLREHS